jgi:predicted HD superfamily hydrolase involved in NAD metabolism
MNVSINEKIVKAKKLITRYLDGTKAAHCLRVAATARDLAEHHKNADPQKAYLAGLLHDLARFLPDAELLQIAAKNQLSIEDYEKEYPVLLHGKVAAFLAKTELNITDQEILAAIQYHTLGRKDMSPLEKIIYVADFIEPHRAYSLAEEVRRTATVDLDRAVAEKARAVLKYAEQNGMYVGEFQRKAASGS